MLLESIRKYYCVEYVIQSIILVREIIRKKTLRTILIFITYSYPCSAMWSSLTEKLTRLREAL